MPWANICWPGEFYHNTRCLSTVVVLVVGSSGRSDSSGNGAVVLLARTSASA